MTAMIRPTPRVMLYIASAVMLATTVVTLSLYGGLAYFLTFHRPLGFAWPTAYHAPVLPRFAVDSQIGASQLGAGATQHVDMKVTPLAAGSGYIEVWVESPAHKQVYRSDTSGNPVQFSQGVIHSLDCAFTVAADWPHGTYRVGEIITSANMQTDYYVKPDIQEFEVQ